MIDTHIHSYFSADSETDPQSYIIKAIDMGLKVLTFTDHYDLDYHEGMCMHFQLESYFNELIKLKEAYKDKIKILIGIEVGMQSHISEKIKNSIKDYPFDYIIGSTHLIRGQDPYFRKLFPKGTSKEDALNEYFDTMYSNLNSYSFFDSMGHIDYLKRYTEFDDNGIYYNEYKEKIDLILKHLIENEKALELNTSGIDEYPFDFKIIKRFKELGGKYITLGSDSHNQNQLCRHFDFCIEQIKLCGFDYITYYENRQPIKIKV